jgi:gliding motility-associated-like protein
MILFVSARQTSKACFIQFMKYLLVLLCLFCCSKVFAQTNPCIQPGQTVQTAFPVCGNTVFTQTAVPACGGIGTPGGCTVSNNNPYFYKFTIATTGTLGFVITPNNPSADYDFSLFNVTNVPVTNIYTNAALRKTGNVSPAGGPTGCTPTGIGLTCGGGGTFNQLQPVVAGEQYVLLVVAFSAGLTGYTLNFTGGTASTVQSFPIAYTAANINCTNTQISLKLNRPIKCNSLAANGSDFLLSPSAGVSIVSAIASSCVAGEFSTDSIVLNLSAPLAANNYIVSTRIGSDGNTLLGICDDPMLVGVSIPVIATAPQTVPIFATTSPQGCNSNKVKFQLNKPVLCNSIAANGSDFEIIGPSAVTISTATFTCTGSPSTTTEIELTTTSPIAVGGAYTLRAKLGTDNNTVIDACGLSQAVGNSTTLNVPSTLNADFTFTINFGCTQNVVSFAHPGNGATAWQWDFDDPASGPLNTSSLQNPTHTYTTYGVKNVKLRVLNNSSCEDTKSLPVNLNNEIKARLTITPNDTVCLGTPIIFTSNSLGNNLNHSWVFGNSQTASIANPAPVTYTQVGTYNGQYTITNAQNCTSDSLFTIVVLPSPNVAFTVDKTKVCENETILFIAQNPTPGINYTWNFGDGNTNTTSLNPNHSYSAAGNYTAKLIANTAQCGTAEQPLNITVVEQPKINLEDNRSVCIGRPVELIAGTNNLFDYEWSTGQTTAQITINGLQSQQISVVVTNDICVATDTINIKVLPTCDIYVPNAFTPNGDNINDVFKVLNAELVTGFSLEIFNRFGEKVFASSNANKGWDGTINGRLAQAGAYVWVLRYTSVNNATKTQRGSILLVR